MNAPKFKVYEYQAPKYGTQVNGSRAVYDLMKGTANGGREAMWLIPMNTKNVPLDVILHTAGTLDTSPVYVREIALNCLETGAASCVLVHNHPSGDPTPSDNDKSITRRIAAALALLDIRLLDHVIVGNGVYHSMIDAGTGCDWKDNGVNRLEDALTAALSMI